MAHKKTTSKPVASHAGRLLRKSNSKPVRKVAASALGQTRGKKH